MYFCYKVIVTTVSYQCCCYSYYREIHLCRYIWFYCLLTYGYYPIFIMFYYKLLQNFDFFTNINLFICFVSEHTFFAADKEIHYLQFLIINNKCKNQIACYQTKLPLKYVALSGFGSSLLGRSWLRLILTGFRSYLAIYYCTQSVLLIALELNVASSVFRLLI